MTPVSSVDESSKFLLLLLFMSLSHTVNVTNKLTELTTGNEPMDGVSPPVLHQVRVAALLLQDHGPLWLYRQVPHKMAVLLLRLVLYHAHSRKEELKINKRKFLNRERIFLRVLSFKLTI